MKTRIGIVVAMAVMALTSCTGSRMATAGEEVDDVYYNGDDRRADQAAADQARSQALAAARANESASGQTSDDDYNQGNNAGSYDDGLAAKNGETEGQVNVDPQAADDFYYSRQVRRFNSNSWDYYSPYYAYDPYYAINTPSWNNTYSNRPWWYDPYYYNGPTSAWGSSWNQPGFGSAGSNFYGYGNSWSVGFGNSFGYSPFGYSAYGFSPYGGFGGYSPYNGFYNSPYGYSPYGGYGNWGGYNYYGSNYGGYGGYGYANGYCGSPYGGGNYYGYGSSSSSASNLINAPRNNPSSLNTSGRPGNRPVVNAGQGAPATAGRPVKNMNVQSNQPAVGTGRNAGTIDRPVYNSPANNSGNVGRPTYSAPANSGNVGRPTYSAPANTGRPTESNSRPTIDHNSRPTYSAPRNDSYSAPSRGNESAPVSRPTFSAPSQSAPTGGGGGAVHRSR